ncbi:hypothetical protein DUNSADRAFT_8368 [Dunaliella salina]|uniref:Uncharacterized protein n=1 Tax=Dunaliella salina TaxID=3046 RepID=A0ABQ7GJP3_DUNSA|nr:hypothetical protein DUNSADRAFT_8368 [Dunaliella salina]|eukprot:KAF5834828.1 hypothetical protein DUNSADRAFT_8368 [Dunaliella salina]
MCERLYNQSRQQPQPVPPHACCWPDVRLRPPVLSAGSRGYDVVPELARGNGPDPDADGAFVDLPLAASEDAEAEVLRRQQLLASDPVARMGVVEALRQGLSAAEALHGPIFHASMARLDPTMQLQVAAALGGRSLG